MSTDERKLAIEYLEGIKDNYIEGSGYEQYPLPEYYAIETAIEALKAQDVPDTNDGDTINRQAAIDICGKYSGYMPRDIHYKIWKELKQLPPIPKRTGRWIPMEVSSGRDSWKCSVCGRRARGKLENLPYCHCGAKMEG